jgi:two-component system C4-dicarboxylate transport sensor histidine kinase DctB
VALLLCGGGDDLVHQCLADHRFSETTRVRTELRSALYTGNLLSELQRTSVVPLLLARDPALIWRCRAIISRAVRRG